RTRHIALFSSDYPSYFWNEVRRGACVAEEQISNFNYVVSYHSVPHRDTQAYLRMLDDVCASGVDAIGIAGQTDYYMNDIIGWIDSKGIAYATFNVDAPWSRRICYIGPDYAEGGRLAAEFLVKVAGKGTIIGVINFCLDRSTAGVDSIVYSERQRGFVEYLEACGGVNYGVQTLAADMGHARLVSAMEAFLSSTSKHFDGLYFIPANHQAIVEALDNLHLAGTIPVVAHDLYETMEEYLERGIITATIDQIPFLQGYYAVLTLERYLETARDPDDRTMLVTHQLVLNSNKHIYQNYFVQKFRFSG
ncbi:MAG: substrate-binding domain-containing protein, partial [Spirochaetota bacterium]